MSISHVIHCDAANCQHGQGLDEIDVLPKGWTTVSRSRKSTLEDIMSGAGTHDAAMRAIMQMQRNVAAGEADGMAAMLEQTYASYIEQCPMMREEADLCPECSSEMPSAINFERVE